MFEKLLKSIPRQLFSIKFLQQFLSTLVFFLFLNFQLQFYCLVLLVSQLGVMYDIIHRIFSQ